MPEQVKVEDKVAMLDMGKKLKARIEIGRKSGECEICDFPIKTLPLELWSLTELELLWINGNKLEAIDGSIGLLHHLQVIKVNANRLTRLPEEIGHLHNLQRLWAHDNRLHALPRTIGLLTRLEHMSLEKNNLTSFPWEFGRLTSLTALSYDEAKVPGDAYPDVQAAVVGLKKDERWHALREYLRRLDVSLLYKKLELPVEVVREPFTDYPSACSLVCDLRKVVLSGHKLEEFPLSIMASFSSLIHLDLSHNRIEVIHPEIGNMTMLRAIILSGNPIEMLPIDIGYATSLTSIDLDFDKLKIPAPAVCANGADSVMAWFKSLCGMRATRDGDLNARDIDHLPIEVCFVTSLTKLDVSNNDISYLHPEVSSLVNLQIFHANNNCIKYLPDSIYTLSNMVDINLDNNDLERLPDEFGSLVSLTNISIRNNKLKTLPPTIGNCREAITFFANQNQLTVLPFSFGNMVKLQELRLHYNHLSYLPWSMKQMTCVTVLLMNQNNFSLFPEPACYMCSVTHANFSQNMIKLIPFEVGNMSSLSSLDLSDNPGLEELPLYLGDITQLKILTIECGALKMPAPEVLCKGIPCVMEHLRTLSLALVEHKLDMSFYGLKRLPLEVRDLPELRDLNLDWNYISEFSEQVCQQCTGMTRLSLRGNRFTEIPTFFNGLASLTALHLDDNPLLKRLPKTLVELDSLVEITVHNCRLTSPPQDIAARNIREIKAYFEKLVEAEFTNELLMDGYSLYDVPPDVPELEKLTSLNMSTNHIKELPAEIGALAALTIMKLDENKLTHLPGNIKDCTSLETLILSANKLKEITDALIHLPRLTTLLLDDNRITVIPDCISRLTALTLLNLDQNYIKVVPDVLGEMTGLEVLNLSRNPFKQAFPPKMCYMFSLRELVCVESRFTIFPTEFGLMTTLEKVELELSAIRVPPKEIACNGLEAIVSYCKLVYDSIASHSLDLREFSFEEVPVDVCTVPGLMEILMDKNQISLIPPQPFRMSKNDSKAEVTDIFDVVSGQTFQAVPDMMDMTSLTKISATYNKLVTLPDTIYKLTNLSELYLDNNQLTSLPEELGEVQTLTLLTLLNNELTVLPVTIGQLNELEVFEADFDTKIIAPPQEITKVRKTKGLSHVLEYMLAFTDARRAPEIELIELELMTVPRELMEDQVGKITSTIKSVSLASNKLSKLPSDMYSLASIAALDLSENHIQELPEGFVDMKTLEALVSFTPCPGLQFVVYVNPAGQGRGRVWDLLIF
jgi:Leucine-rich repeat (LRR) protein